MRRKAHTFLQPLRISLGVKSLARFYAALLKLCLFEALYLPTPSGPPAAVHRKAAFKRRLPFLAFFLKKLLSKEGFIGVRFALFFIMPSANSAFGEWGGGFAAF